MTDSNLPEMSGADHLYMRRAIQLARCGDARTATNPLVGAVITAHGRIIGEGYHRRYGGPHAEVNAIRSVAEADRHLLTEATIYVTLEPCSHYGKTPPCARLLIDTGIPRIVIGSNDPFPQVAGRGIRMLRDAGREVVCGVLEEECMALNRRFMTAHTRLRPYIQLKWAQSADGFIAPLPGKPRAIFSNPLSMALMHRQRALAGAILVGVNTLIADNPRLDCRLWPGDNPVAATRESPRIPADSNMMNRHHILRRRDEPLPEFLHRLYEEEKINSLMVEGGAVALQEFIDAGLFDEMRIETSPLTLGDGIPAPVMPSSGLTLSDNFSIRENNIRIFRRL